MKWIILVLTLLAYETSAGHLTACMTNCAQCKRMLGHFFKGPMCAETCLESFGFATPDCNKPYSLWPYLRNNYS